MDDFSDDSNPMVTDTRIRVVNPLRKLFLGSAEGVHRLTGDVNPESTWAWRCDRYLPAPAGPVRCLAREPGTGLLLAGLGEPGGGLLLSEDGGKHWQPAPGWAPEAPVSALATPGSGRVLLGGPGGLSRGELPEGDWSRCAESPGTPVDFSQDPTRPARWLAAVAGGPSLVSEDGGATWAPLPGSEAWGARAVAHTRAGVALVGTASGLLRSLDGGATWAQLERPSGEVRGLCVDVAGTVYAAVPGTPEGPLWSSQDKGHTWTPVAGAAGLAAPAPDQDALQADTLHPGVVYLAAGAEVYLVTAEASRRIGADLTPARQMLVL